MAGEPADDPAHEKPWTPADPATQELLRTGGAVVPILGAGVSVPAGVSSFEHLAEVLAGHELAAGITFTNTKRGDVVAKEILEVHPDESGRLRRFVAEHFKDQQEGADPGQVLRNLTHCPSRIVLTFNYDHLLEAAAEAERVAPCQSYTWQDLPPPYWMSEGPPTGLHIIHLHGSVEEPDSIVLDPASYDRVKFDGTVQNFLRNLFSQMSACFLGTSLNEPYVIEVIEQTQAGVPRHVFFNDEATAREARRERLANTDQAVILEPFDSGQFYVLEGLTRHLANARVPRRVSETPHPSSPYVPLPIVRYREGMPNEAEMWLSISWPGEPMGEDDVAVKPRTIVRGQPGSGKSDLLRRLAQLSEGRQHDVHSARFVRLANCAPPVGDGAAVLAGWAGLDKEEVKTERFHFLLDGLDELRPDDRQSYAQALVNIAEALPQHRYTLTSREIPELSAFPGEWEQLQIGLSSEWRSRFLTCFEARDGRGRLSWPVLIEEVPELSALEPLLRLPFFLKGVVRLYGVGHLPRDGDVVSLLEALIGDGLDAEELQPIGEEPARRWLSDLAWAMQLNGVVSFPRSLCDEISAKVSIGDSREVIDRLVNRSLLRTEGEAVSFVHRLLADALVALRLEELGSEHPGLLDAIAPTAGEASFRRVRRSWLVPVILVCSQSQEWREAIRSVDELTAARCVPPSADPEERLAAAETLWDYYKEVRVWMNDRDLPVLLDTDEHLPRLIAPPEMQDLVDRIRGDLGDPSAQVRANGIEVLSRLDGVDIEGELARAIGDTEETVRRAAALAARRLKLTSLFDPIRDLAVGAKSVEAQEVGLAAISLAPDNDALRELAEELIRSGSDVPDYWIEREVEERLGALGRLMVHRWQAASGSRISINERHGLVELLGDLDLESDDVMQDIGYIAAIWDLKDPEVREAIAAQPDAAFRGMLEATSSGGAPVYHLFHFLDVLPAETLSGSTYPTEGPESGDELQTDLIERQEWMQAQAARPPAAVDEGEHGEDIFDSPATAELTEAIDAGDEDLLLARPLRLARDVSKLNANRRERLEDFVRAWWPASIGDAVETVGDGQRFTMTPEAMACVVYGAALRLPLSAERWTDVALTPLYFDQVQEWLSESFETSMAGEVLEGLRQASSVRVWARVFDAVTEWPHDADVADAVAGLNPEGDENDFGAVAAALARLQQNGALRALYELGGNAAPAAQRFLAELGDPAAQEAMLDRLREDLGGTSEITAESLTWMSGIEDAALLPKVFDCLAPAWEHRNPGGFNDSMAPIRATIRRIGGDAALALLDEFLEGTEPFPGAHFEIYLRDEIADDMLQASGVPHDQALLEESDLPRIPA